MGQGGELGEKALVSRSGSAYMFGVEIISALLNVAGWCRGAVQVQRVSEPAFAASAAEAGRWICRPRRGMGTGPAFWQSLQQFGERAFAAAGATYRSKTPILAVPGEPTRACGFTMPSITYREDRLGNRFASDQPEVGAVRTRQVGKLVVATARRRRPGQGVVGVVE